MEIPTNLSAQVAKIQTKINELKSKRFKYFIMKYIDNYGNVQNIATEEELILAFRFVKGQFNDENKSDLFDELGLSKEKTTNEQIWLGFTLAEWTEEFKERANELKRDSEILRMEYAITKLKTYYSENDRFQEDMSVFGDLLDFGTESTESI